ncbi:MAG: MFS transporter [Acidobacteriaceae bacterium]
MLAPPSTTAASIVQQRSDHAVVPKQLLLPFALIAGQFFLWGIPDNLNDVLIRQFMKSFALSRFQAGLVQSAFYLGYSCFALPAALLMRKYGYKAGFIAGPTLFGAGSMLFWPAAIVGRYSFFLVALFVLASGLSFLETAANPFIAQFLYVGAQVGTWSYFIQYIQQYTHQPEKIAGYFLTGTLAVFGVGRFSSAYLMRFIAPDKLMGTYCLCNIALVGTAVFFPGWAGLWAIFLTSFFMSIMFPTIFVLGIEGLGDLAKVASSVIVMAIVGGAVLTPAMGMISQVEKSAAIAYLVPLAAYVGIAWYSFLGSHVRT